MSAKTFVVMSCWVSLLPLLASAEVPAGHQGVDEARAVQADPRRPTVPWPKLGPAKPLDLEALKKRYRWIAETIHLSERPPQRGPVDPRAYFLYGPAQPPHPFYQARFQRQLDNLTHSRMSAGNTLRLLPNSASFARKLQWMHKAQHSLYVAAMVYHCDAGGKAYADALIAAKQRGVDVRLVIDGIMQWAAGNCLRRLRHAGVQVVVSNRSLIPTKIDWEMHDKLFVVDADQAPGAVAIVGGQNIGSWYFDSNGVDSNYRDTDIEVQGPATRAIARRFVQIWQELRPLDASLEGYQAGLQDADLLDAAQARLGANNYPAWLQGLAADPVLTGDASAPTLGQPVDNALCRFVSQDPYRQTFHVFDAYTRLAQTSKRRLVMHALAFDPVGSRRQKAFLQALMDLSAKPDARVDVITNGPGLLQSQTMPSQLGFLFGVQSLNSAYTGIEGTQIHIWAYRSYVHSKAFLFDDAALAIGSFNYDDSATRCQESSLICISPGLIAQAQQMFARDLANASEVSLSPEQRLRSEDLKAMRSSSKKMRKRD